MSTEWRSNRNEWDQWDKLGTISCGYVDKAGDNMKAGELYRLLYFVFKRVPNDAIVDLLDDNEGILITTPNRRLWYASIKEETLEWSSLLDGQEEEIMPHDKGYVTGIPEDQFAPGGIISTGQVLQQYTPAISDVIKHGGREFILEGMKTVDYDEEGVTRIELVYLSKGNTST